MMEGETANQGTTYEPLEGRRRIESTDSPDEATPPRDRNGVLYIALLAAGIGFVLPYNSFIIASDYWEHRFQGTSVILDMSMTYIIVAFATVLLNNVFLTLFSFKVRILFGYAISLTTLIFVALCEIAWHMFNEKTTYSINLVVVSLTAIGCTVQQSSFYGFASMFPKKYTQAVMAGESLAGLLVASTRILIKAIISNNELSTVIFFLISTTYIALSYILHSTTVHSPFVRYHMRACSKIVLRPDEDRVLSDMLDDATSTKYGILTATPPTMRHNHNLHQHSLSSTTAVPTTGLSFSNPVYELSNPSAGESTLDGLNLPDALIPSSPTPPPQNIITDTLPNVAYKVEHVLAPGCSGGTGHLGNFSSGLEARWKVARAIYPYMVCIALAYCVTLSLYPGIVSQIGSCYLDTWMPVSLMFTFNASDVIGKVMASFPYTWSRHQLILLSTMRISLVPLILLCCAPRAQPVIAGEIPAFIFTAAFGITNGLAGSLPMMLAPAKVPATLKEITGNMMTLSYNIGLTAGSLIAYVFVSMLGQPLIDSSCPKEPYVPISMVNTSTTSTTVTTLIKTTVSTMTTMVARSTTKAVTLATSTLVPTTSPATTTTIASIANTTLATIIASIATHNLSTEETVVVTLPTIIASTALYNSTTLPLLNITSH